MGNMIRVAYLKTGGLFRSSRYFDSPLAQLDLDRDIGLGQIYARALKSMGQRVI
jgi:hypothetical protein